MCVACGVPLAQRALHGVQWVGRRGPVAALGCDVRGDVVVPFVVLRVVSVFVEESGGAARCGHSCFFLLAVEGYVCARSLTGTCLCWWLRMSRCLATTTTSMLTRRNRRARTRAFFIVSVHHQLGACNSDVFHANANRETRVWAGSRRLLTATC